MNSGRRTARQEEEFHVQRRNAELRKQEHWNNVADYFKTWDVKASKYASWSSPQYYQQSENARAQAENSVKKKQTLAERREKLKQFLDHENKMFEDEIKIKCRSRQSAWMPLDELKSVNLELKRRSDEARKREAELLLYHRWKQQQPTLKDLESRQHVEFLKKSWVDQVKEREAARERQKVEEALRLKEEELRRKQEIEVERLHKQKKEEEIKELKQQIKLQMDTIKESVKSYQELEKQEAEEMKLKSQVEEMIIQRQLAEKRQANKQLVGFWTRQYQLKLQKKAKEVEEEIAQDQKMLERLDAELKEEARNKIQAKEIAKQEMELALKELQTQRQRELLRQKEYDHMFFEEAKRTWETQERKWSQERHARDALMRQVLDTVGKQIEEKLKKKQEMKASSLENREELLKGINRLYEQCNERELSVEQYRRDLDNQVSQNTIEKVKKAQEESEFERKQMQAQQEYDQKLAAEMDQMQLNFGSYRPQNFRRQRIAW